MGLRGGDLSYFQQEIGVYILMIAVVMLLLLLNMLREVKRQKTAVQNAVAPN